MVVSLSFAFLWWCACALLPPHQFVQARAITDRDEKSLASQLEQLEKQAQEELEAEFD